MSEHVGGGAGGGGKGGGDGGDGGGSGGPSARRRKALVPYEATLSRSGDILLLRLGDTAAAAAAVSKRVFEGSALLFSNFVAGSSEVSVDVGSCNSSSDRGSEPSNGGNGGLRSSFEASGRTRADLTAARLVDSGPAESGKGSCVDSGSVGAGGI